VEDQRKREKKGRDKKQAEDATEGQSQSTKNLLFPLQPNPLPTWKQNPTKKRGTGQRIKKRGKTHIARKYRKQKKREKKRKGQKDASGEMLINVKK
jgi:hypothetical protein